MLKLNCGLKIASIYRIKMGIIMKIIRLLFLSTVLILGNFISKISFAETNLLESEKN